jgi:hypothetical protein
MLAAERAPASAPAFAPAPPLSPPALPSCVLAPALAPAPIVDGAHGDPVLFVEPTMISIAHWGRLDEGELFAKSRHIDWAVLMKRTWGLDVMRCPACAHRLRVMSTSPSAAS